MAEKPNGKSFKHSKKHEALPAEEVVIESLDDDGIGCSRYRGKPLLIPGAFVGEKVLYQLEYQGHHRSGGRLLRVVSRAPERIKSPCKIEHACLGCPFISMRYSAQLQLKLEKVQAAFARFDTLKEVQSEPVLTAEQQLGYRTNAKLAIAKEQGKVRIGIYRRGTHDVVDLKECTLHHPLINRIITVVAEEIEKQGIWVYDPRKRRGLLRYLLVRIAPHTGEALVTLVATERDYRQTTHLAKWLVKKVPEVVSVQMNVNSSEGNVILGRQTYKLVGHQTLRDMIGETRLAISPASFFQVNHEQAQRIYALVRKWAELTPAQTALDVYCGIGGIALNLARDAGEVLGIEVVEEAVRNARDNARLNRLNNCRFIAGDAAELLDDLQGEMPPGFVATVNPPRKGCDREVLDALCALQPRALIYVSCNPESLAADLDHLCRNGWRVDQVQPVDMFPQTPHVETVVKLLPQA
jgi:23S rRNA (uracil1939-C5)-methyltransferase